MEKTPSKCSSCGRNLSHNYNKWIEGDNRPLCSFCVHAERQLLKAKKEQTNLSNKYTYCRSCGMRLSIKFLHDGCCFDCFKLKTKQLAKEIKLATKRRGEKNDQKL